MPPPNYEYLIWNGSRGLTRRTEYDLKQMDFGGGFYAAALTGPPGGVTSWTLNFRAHRDRIRRSRIDHNVLVPFQPRLYDFSLLLPDGTIDTDAPDYHPISEYIYVRDFVRRRMAASNEPFFFEDLDAVVTGPEGAQDFSQRSRYLCRLLENTIEFTQDQNDPLVYTCTLSFREVRGWPAPEVPEP